MHGQNVVWNDRFGGKTAWIWNEPDIFLQRILPVCTSYVLVILHFWHWLFCLVDFRGMILWILYYYYKIYISKRFLWSIYIYIWLDFCPCYMKLDYNSTLILFKNSMYSCNCLVSKILSETHFVLRAKTLHITNVLLSTLLRSYRTSKIAFNT